MLPLQFAQAMNDVRQEFSADAYMQIPYQAPTRSKIYVSKKAVRTESNMNGKAVIEIVYPDDGKRVLLYQQQKKYSERTVPVTGETNSKTRGPCQRIPGSQCELLGKEKIADRPTEKWQVTVMRNGLPVKSLHWIDTEHKLALREFFPDSSISELKLIKKEKVNQRNTEKWQRTLTRPDGTQSVSYQWYDPELGIAIREELSEGYVRELKNIKVGKQAKKLFRVPADYKLWTYAPDQAQMQSGTNR